MAGQPEAGVRREAKKVDPGVSAKEHVLILSSGLAHAQFASQNTTADLGPE
jgi:hypothetical protein